MKNKKNNPLNAKILLAPVKKILSAPFPNIGKERSALNKSITKIDVRSILSKAIGTSIVFVFMMDFLLIKFATTQTNKNKNTIKVIG